MPTAAAKHTVTLAEYIAAETASRTKHQLIAGEVFDMSGGTPEHAAIIASVGVELGSQLRGRPCRLYASELRVGIDDLVTYPDASVVCGDLERHPDEPTIVLNPTVLVEVLSDTTEAYDRGEKAQRYRRIPSLREYVLVSQHRAHIELFRRTQEGWILVEAHEGERLRVESIDCWLDVDAVYDGILDRRALAASSV
jgi:Uma2 family endonuclease